MKSESPKPQTVPPAEQAISVALAIVCGLLAAYFFAPYAQGWGAAHASGSASSRRRAEFFPFIIGAMFAYAAARALLKLLRK